MLVGELPPSDRPRERLLTSGAEALSDRELLALLLRTGGTAGTSAHELAERLLAHFGDLAGVAGAVSSDLFRFAGIGPAKAATLLAAFELSRRRDQRDHRSVLSTSADIAGAARQLLAERSRERTVVLSCDTRLRLLGIDVIGEGGAASAPLPVREALAAVLRRDGTAFAIAHNHPSGDPTPSTADVDATPRLRDAAERVGLRFLDHVIVAGRRWRSVTSAR